MTEGQRFTLCIVVVVAVAAIIVAMLLRDGDGGGYHRVCVEPGETRYECDRYEIVEG